MINKMGTKRTKTMERKKELMNYKSTTEKRFNFNARELEKFRVISLIKGTSMSNMLNKVIKDFNESHKDSLIRAYKMKRG